MQTGLDRLGAARCEQLLTDCRVVLHQGHQGIELMPGETGLGGAVGLHRRQDEIPSVPILQVVDGAMPMGAAGLQPMGGGSAALTRPWLVRAWSDLGGRRGGDAGAYPVRSLP